MKTVKKRCVICGKWYVPDPRTCHIQKCCSDQQCRKKRKAQTDKIWRGDNPGYGKGRKTREWAQSYPDYWKKYRREHPEYVEKDNRRRRMRYKKGKISAKQATTSEIFVERLRGIQQIGLDFSAKQATIDRRVDGLLDSLIWREFSAKQTDIARYP